jgi:hypothetical protein
LNLDELGRSEAEPRRLVVGELGRRKVELGRLVIGELRRSSLSSSFYNSACSGRRESELVAAA